MVNHKIATAVLAGALFAAPPAMAQFGSLLSNLTSLAGGGSSSVTNPDTFIQSAIAAEKLMNNSVTLLSRSLISKEKSAEFEAERKAAMLITDAAERNAKLTEVRKSNSAALNEAAGNAKLEDDIKMMDDKKRGDLSSAAFNFMLALLQDKALVFQAHGLISSLASNPMNLMKLGNIKDLVSSLTNQVADASGVAGKMPQIFSAVGVTPPTSKDDKPKLVAEVDSE